MRYSSLGLSILLVPLLSRAKPLIGQALQQLHFVPSTIAPAPRLLPQHLNLLQTSIEELNLFLSNGSITSIDLVHAYLSNIDNNNHKGANLRAVIQTAPVELLMTIATGLDNERANGRTRGLLHGIPMLVKANMATDVELMMDTSAGNFALKQSKVKNDADVVKRLRDAGAIILGKTNLDELSGWKAHQWFSANATNFSSISVNGWSAVGGLTTSAYVSSGDPLGSSSGSAVGVSAGFAAAALGSDTTGSVIYPANRAALFGIRPTTDLVSSQGVVPITADLDAVGPLAFTARDAAIILDILSHNDGRYLKATANASLNSLRFGLVRNNYLDGADGRETKSAACVEEIETSLKSTMKILEGKGGVTLLDVNLDLSYTEQVMISDRLADLMTMGMKDDLEAYMADLEESPVRTIRDLIEWNEASADLELPADRCCQQRLMDTLLSSGRASPEYNATWKEVQHLAGDRGFSRLFEKHKLDALIFSPELGLAPRLVAAMGYAAGTAPMGYCKNGQPFGILMVVKPNMEESLMGMLAAYEAIMPKRRVPGPFPEIRT